MGRLHGLLEERATVKMDTRITKKICNNAASRITIKSSSHAKIHLEMVGMEATLKLMERNIVNIFLLEKSFWMSLALAIWTALVNQRFVETSKSVLKIGEMRTVIPSVLVLQRNRHTATTTIMLKNVVYDQEHTPSIVNVRITTDGMVDMWKSME